jgi:hypothetical protein
MMEQLARGLAAAGTLPIAAPRPSYWAVFQRWTKKTQDRHYFDCFTKSLRSTGRDRPTTARDLANAGRRCRTVEYLMMRTYYEVRDSNDSLIWTCRTLLAARRRCFDREYRIYKVEVSESGAETRTELKRHQAHGLGYLRLDRSRTHRRRR